MTQYTIAERQEIKDRLADEQYFEQDLALFAQLFPHHVLVGECKRVNKMNRLSLQKRIIYHMLTRVSAEQIKANRKHNRIKEASEQILPESVRDIRGKIQEKVSGWKQKLQKLLSGGK